MVIPPLEGGGEGCCVTGAATTFRLTDSHTLIFLSLSLYLFLLSLSISHILSCRVSLRQHRGIGREKNIEIFLQSLTQAIAGGVKKNRFFSCIL